jgi:lipopolysaccharide transport system permease protein
MPVIQAHRTIAEPPCAGDGLPSSLDLTWQEAPLLRQAEPVTIASDDRWLLPDFRELWAHRELFYLLVVRDIKVRYKQTVLGAAWAVLQPFLTMVVFSVFFGRLAGVPSDGIPYPIFAYAGLLPWMFFANAVSGSANSLVESSALITKVYFPRLLIPAAAILAVLLDFAIASIILFGMMAWYGIWPDSTILMLPVLLALIVAAALAAGFWLSALNVKYRDVRYAVPFLMQVWLYISPVIYPASLVPAKWRWLVAFNPVAGTLEGYRSALLAIPFNWPGLAISGAATLVFLLYGTRTFLRMEDEFADII